ncbi:unnamed protein product, partial [Symbiodinium microadriaticum]
MGWVPRAWLARWRLSSQREGGYISERSLYVLQQHICQYLNSPFPFHIKLLVKMRIQRTNPATGEWEEDDFYQNIVPWISRPAVDPNFRMHAIVSAARWKFEIAEERSALPGSDWTVAGLEWIEVLLTPGLEQVPAPGVGGGARGVVKLPASLSNRKGIWNPQKDRRCFQWCLRAAFLDIGELNNDECRHTVRCTGPPFFHTARKRGRPGDDDPRQLVDVGLDFSAVNMDVVPIEAITNFELSNLGVVEVVVYQWVDEEQDGMRHVGKTLLRPPPEEVLQARSDNTRIVTLLLHENHYMLIYNFNAFAGRRGEQLESNFRSELALRNHFKKAQCRSDFEGRNSQISLPSPQNNVLQYRTKSTCELSPLVVYADFEVFSKEVAGDASVLGVQNRVAAVGYAAVGMCGYNPPDSHRLCMIHAQEGEHECAVVVKFLVAMIDLSKDFKDWRTFRAGSAGRGKVAHQLHGSGRYDFHFVLRAFAKFKAEARKALEVGNVEMFASLPPAAIKILLSAKISILQNSGETNLTMDIGALRFLDTMNFCKAGLGKLIDSHRKAALKPANLRGMSEVSGLEQAFPLTASRHPLLKDADEDVWAALLRKLPMPWDFFVGCGDFSKPAVWPLECYRSKLSGKCPEEDHSLLEQTASFMGFNSFRDVFDTYLALDITAFADLMQVLNDKAFHITREYARPLGHWRNAFVGLWVKIEQRMPIFEKILEFVRGPAPQMREEWGEPVRELI